MAVTFHQQPDITKYHASDSNIDFVFSSNSIGQPNFSFIVSVEINGAEVSRDMLFPITSGRAHFDASIYTRVFSKMYFGESSISQDQMKTARIVVRERYGLIPTTKTTLYISNLLNVYKGYNEGNTSFPIKGSVLTSKRNITFPTLINFPMLIGWIQNDASSNSFSTINPASSISYTSLGNDGGLRYFDASIMLGTATDLTSFEFETNDGEVITYQFDSCKKYTLIWLNKFGGYDFYTDIHNHTTDEDYEDFKYSKAEGQWLDNSFTRDKMNGNASYLKNFTKGGSIITEDLDDDDQLIIREMLRSPFVLFATQDGFQRIDIENKSWALNQTYYEESEPIEIKYKEIKMHQSQLI